MKKKKLTLLSAVAAAAVLAACTADEILSERRVDQLAYMAEEQTPVQVVTAWSENEWTDEADTRAGQSLNDQVFSLMYSTNSASAVCLRADDGQGTYSSYQYNVVGTTGANAISPNSSAAYFPAGVTTVNVYGWYPYNSGSTSFSVSNNQTADANYILSDLMLANKSQCKRVKSNNVYTISDGNKATLAFRHVMAKIKLNVTAGTGVTINSVKFASVKRTVAISGPNGSGTVSIGDATGSGEEITVYGTIAAGATANVAAVIPPQTVKGNFIVINATYGSKTGNVTYQLDGTTGKTFAGNTVYTATMTVNKQDIQQTISIAEWTNAQGSVTVEPTTSTSGGDINFTGDTDMTLTYNGANGTVTINESGTYTAISSNTGIATVNVVGTTVTVAPVAAGSAKVYVTKSDGTDYGVINVTVAKANGSVTLDKSSVTGINKNGGTATVNVTAHSSTGAITASSSNTGIATVSVEGTVVTVTGAGTAGTATITVTAAADANYNEATATFTATTVDMSTPTFTAPTAKSLTYNGSAQTLINAGSTSDGTMYYTSTTTNSKPSSTSGFTTSVPTQIDAGTYYVWYYVKGDDTHLDSDIAGSVSVTIAKRTPSLSKSPTNLTIIKNNNGNVTISGSSASITSVSSNNTSIATASYSGNTVTVHGVSKGSTTITVQTGSNSNDNTASTSFTVNVNEKVSSSLATLSALKDALGANMDASDYIGYYVDASGNISSTNNSAVGVILYINSSSTVFVGTDNKSQTYYDSNPDSNKSNARILVCALSDISTGMTWNAITSTTASEWNSAPSRPDGASKWFIPTSTQLSNMSATRFIPRIIPYNVFYWSCTEYRDGAYSVYSNSGEFSIRPKTESNYVRAFFAY